MNYCPKCHQPLHEEAQQKFIKQDGEWISVPGTSTYTCSQPDCNRQWITLNGEAIQALTDAEAARYPRKGSY